jgi:hypothetical protein
LTDRKKSCSLHYADLLIDSLLFDSTVASLQVGGGNSYCSIMTLRESETIMTDTPVVVPMIIDEEATEEWMNLPPSSSTSSLSSPLSTPISPDTPLFVARVQALEEESSSNKGNNNNDTIPIRNATTKTMIHNNLLVTPPEPATKDPVSMHTLAEVCVPPVFQNLLSTEQVNLSNIEALVSALPTEVRSDFWEDTSTPTTPLNAQLKQNITHDNNGVEYEHHLMINDECGILPDDIPLPEEPRNNDDYDDDEGENNAPTIEDDPATHFEREESYLFDAEPSDSRDEEDYSNNNIENDSSRNTIRPSELLGKQLDHERRPTTIPEGHSMRFDDTEKEGESQIEDGEEERKPLLASADGLLQKISSSLIHLTNDKDDTTTESTTRPFGSRNGHDKRHENDQFVPYFTSTLFFASISKKLLPRYYTPLAAATWIGFWALFLVTCTNYVLTPIRDAIALQIGVQHMPKLTLASTVLAFFSSVPIGWLFEAPDPNRRRLWKRMGLTRGETQGTSLALFYRCFAIILISSAVGFMSIDCFQARTTTTTDTSAVSLDDRLSRLQFVFALTGQTLYISFFLIVHLMKLHSLSLVWGVTTEAMEYEEVARRKSQMDSNKTRLQKLGAVGFGGTLGGILGRYVVYQYYMIDKMWCLPSSRFMMLLQFFGIYHGAFTQITGIAHFRCRFTGNLSGIVH